LKIKLIELVKPQTFMNLSGEAINCLLKKAGREAGKIDCYFDDLALPLGKSLRAKVRHGGHNGLKSIIDCLRTKEFIRLRIGIQPEHPIRDTKRFRVGKFFQNGFGNS
jgi:PTH1 family peptidyl-tRNA hydrolase